jgi:coenzyme F420-reducing hydrogenase gamma subunit
MDECLDLLQQVEVVNWREVSSERRQDYEIAFCEGSITTEHDMERVRKIRKQARILVSLGACASIGCHNALKNRYPMEESLRLVYGEKADYFETLPARPVTAVVEVDYQIQGCPTSLPEIAVVFKKILSGQDHTPSNDPVCVECKRKDNLCVYEKGLICLGPVTRCGCGAICTTFGDACQGCRGLIDDANVQAAVRALTGEDLHSIMARVVGEHQLSKQDIINKIAIYNRPRLKEEGNDGA